MKSLEDFIKLHVRGEVLFLRKDKILSMNAPEGMKGKANLLCGTIKSTADYYIVDESLDEVLSLLKK